MRRHLFLCNFGIGGAALLPATFNFSTLADGAIPASLAGSSWSIVSGAAKVTVTLGAEAVVNGGFTAWTGDNPDNWAVLNENGTNYVTQVGNAARFIGVDTALTLRQAILAANTWYKITAECTAITTAGPTIGEHTVAFGKFDTLGSLEWCDLRESSSNLSIARSGTNDVTFTNISARPVTLPSALMTMDAATPEALVSAALDLTLTTGQGNYGGVIARLDSATNPLNFILATYDGVRIRIWKCLNGTYTSLYNTGTNTYRRYADIRIVCNGDIVQVFYDEAQVGADLTVSDAAIVGNTLFGAFGIKSDAKIARLIVAENDYVVPSNGLFGIGDSRMLSTTNTWMETLMPLLNATNPFYLERPTRYGISGYTTAQMEVYVTANLAAAVGSAHTAIINLGVNDAAAMPLEADFKADYISIIDQLRTKYAGIKCYLARPWRSGQAANCNTIAGWIADIVATYVSNVSVGTDERIWLENGDNGATYTTDGVHYSAAGQIENANQWYAVLTT